jgi:hypothetical protein
MRRQMLFHSLSSLETLDLRLSPSSLSLGGSLLTPVISHQVSADDDPLPNPEPSPGPLPPDPQPTDPFPGLPPSGPAGPGTS